MPEIKSYQVSLSSVKDACRQSIDWLAATAAPHIYIYKFPEYYRAIFQVLSSAIVKERDFSKIALGFPRGFAKSTFLKFIILWAIQFSGKRNIVIICANDSLVKNFIADLALLLDHENITKIFGNWRTSSIRTTQTDLEFKLDGRLIKISGAGQGASLRGLVRDGSRPDFIVLDDIQTREDADSETISAKILDWLYGTINFLRSPFGCTYVFLGNMYPTPHSVLKKLIADPEWQTFIASGITDSGESLWEELHPLKQLYADFRSLEAQGKEDIFWAEIMNVGDMNSRLSFDPGRLKPVPLQDLEFHQGCYLVIDPAGRKKKSDDTAIGAFKLRDGVPHCIHLVHEILTPKQTIFRAIDLATTFGATLIAAEDVAYQESLVFWFEEFLSTQQLSNLVVVGINSGGISKNTRLISVIKSAQVGEIKFTDITAKQFSDQAIAFNPLITNNKDDVLDICEYALKIPQIHGNLIAYNSPGSDQFLQDIPLISEEVTSPF
jgi:hypothetical protein